MQTKLSRERHTHVSPVHSFGPPDTSKPEQVRPAAQGLLALQISKLSPPVIWSPAVGATVVVVESSVEVPSVVVTARVVAEVVVVVGRVVVGVVVVGVVVVLVDVDVTAAVVDGVVVEGVVVVVPDSHFSSLAVNRSLATAAHAEQNGASGFSTL